MTRNQCVAAGFVFGVAVGLVVLVAKAVALGVAALVVEVFHTIVS